MSPAAAPPLPRRLLDVLVSPLRLFAALRDDPRWGGALLASSALVLLAYWLIPADVWAEVFREQALRAGQAFDPALMRSPLIRVSSSVASVVMPMLTAFLVAGLTTVLFPFVLGDEGSYRQHLAVVAHAFLVPALAAVALVPLRIALADPQATLDLALFVPGLDPRGYPFRVLRFLDLFQLWGWMLIAAGMTTLDPRRGFGSAAAILAGVAVGFAMLLAALLPGAPA